MIVDIYPSKVSGTITPPPSKSILHRSIISSCMSRGLCKIHNVVYSDDIIATIAAFESLGVIITKEENALIIDARTWSIDDREIVVDCNESGSTIRFLIPLLSNINYDVFKGKSILIKRPMDIYFDMFKKQDLFFEKGTDFIKTKGALSPGNYLVQGDVSSQFISGLMFLLPTLSGDSSIQIIGDLESSEYVDITIDVLRAYNINIYKNGNIFSIKGNQHYKPTDYYVESDYSQLAFFAVLGIVNNNLVISNINPHSLQPDRRIFDVIASMKGVFQFNETSIKVVKSKTHKATIDVSQCPDIAPIIGLLAACSEGETKIINAKRLTLKESNRLLSTYKVLQGFGVEVYLGEDSLTIVGTRVLHANTFDSSNDHRMAMMISIGATIADGKVTITNADAINKSYPYFYKDLQSLGAVIKYR